MSRGNKLLSESSQAFICINCGITVTAPSAGTAYRNHCPRCLWSRHVDLRRGDRLSVCRGAMEPLSICASSGEWSLIHRCIKCGTIRINRVAGDDNSQEMVNILDRIQSVEPEESKAAASCGRKP